MYSYQSELIRIRDLMAGSSVIKAKSTLYLPELGIPELYPAYLSRALLFEVLPATVDSYLGLVYRVDPVVDIPEELNGFKLNAGEGTLYTVVKKVLRETIVSGVAGVLIDIDDSGSPYLSVYQREDILSVNYSLECGRKVLTYVKLRETVTNFDEASGNTTSTTRERVLRLVNGIYTVSVSDEYGKSSSTTTPTAMGGGHLGFIPMVFACADGSNIYSGDVRPPLAALSATNIAHYQTTADLRQSLFYSGNPQLILQGFGPTADGSRKMGPGMTLETSEPTAKAYYLEPLPIGPLTDELKRLEELMSRLGADVFISDAMALTATEASIRNTAKNSRLTNITVGVSDAITQVLSYVCAILRIPSDNARYELNTKYFTVTDTTYITSLLSLYLSKTISLDSFLSALQSQELIPDAAAEKDKLVGGKTQGDV